MNAAAQTLSSSTSFENRRHLREKLFDNPNTDMPLLSFFNLQGYAQGDWDSPDFSASKSLSLLFLLCFSLFDIV